MKVSKENQAIDIYTQTRITDFDRFQGKHLLLDSVGKDSQCFISATHLDKSSALYLDDSQIIYL